MPGAKKGERARDYRLMDKKAMQDKLMEYKKELSTLRVNKLSAPAAKTMKICVIRKNIARLLTVMNQKTKGELRKLFHKKNNNRLPKDLRYRKTRALRRALTKHERSLKTPKQHRKDSVFPRKRKFAVKL